MRRCLLTIPTRWNWLPSGLALGVLWLSIVSVTSLTRPKPNALPQEALATADSPDIAPETPANPEPELEPDVVVDAGHGGNDPGTQGNSILEKNGALEIAKQLAAALRARGLKVTMTREGDDTVPNPDRAKLSNSRPRLAFISVHLNHGMSARGIETYFAAARKPAVQLVAWQQAGLPKDQQPRDNRNEKLAKAVHSSAIKATGAADRGVRRGDGFLVLNSTACPALLIECGFVSDSAEASRLKNTAYQTKLANGIADGLVDYLAKAKDEPGFGFVR